MMPRRLLCLQGSIDIQSAWPLVSPLSWNVRTVWWGMIVRYGVGRGRRASRKIGSCLNLQCLDPHLLRSCLLLQLISFPCQLKISDFAYGGGECQSLAMNESPYFEAVVVSMNRKQTFQGGPDIAVFRGLAVFHSRKMIHRVLADGTPSTHTIQSAHTQANGCVP